MLPDIHDAVVGRLGRLVLALSVIFVIGVVLLRPQQLILLLNGLALAVSTGVTGAYLSIAGNALRHVAPSRGDVLGAGICFAGLADIALRVQSILARDFGHPDVVNSDFAALSIFLGVMSLVSFLWAPFAEDGRVPRDKWGPAVLVLAVGLMVAFAAGFAQRTMSALPLVRLQ